MKTIVKTIAFCILVVLFLFTQGESVMAKNVKLYVDAEANSGGDGKKNNPFRRISDAVAQALLIYQANTNSKIEIRVESGTYSGSYSNPNPKKENLPIILDIPILKLKGSTSLRQSTSGFSIQQFGLANDKSIPSAYLPNQKGGRK